MAKRIKAIKCPSCGGTRAKELRPDYYRCDNCGTKFFLDSDDITIHHNHHYNTSSGTGISRKIMMFAGLAVGGATLFFILMLALGSSNSSDRQKAYTLEKEKNAYRWNNDRLYSFTDQKGSPVHIVIGQLRSPNFTDSKNEAVYCGVYSAGDHRRLNLDKIGDVPEGFFTSDINFRVFEDRQLYLIISNSKIYRFNRQTLRFNEVTPVYIKEIPALQSGVAKAEFQYADNGSGFRIVTNEGNQVVFYPLIGKVYDKDKIADAYRQPISGAGIKTGFTFSSASSDFPGEKPQLIRYRYRHKDGYPLDDPRFEWQKDFGGSGIFTERSPYTKRFISRWSREVSRLVDYEDFTPGRNYFDARVLAYNVDEVLISVKATPAPNEKLTVQILDAGTARVKWSTHPAIPFPSNYLLLNSGYVLGDGNKAVYMDSSGNVIKKFETDEIAVTLK